MTGLFRLNAIACALAIPVLSGCAAKNPDWLVHPTGAFCAASLDSQCLKGFAESTYAAATARIAAKRAVEKAVPPDARSKTAADSQIDDHLDKAVKPVEQASNTNVTSLDTVAKAEASPGPSVAAERAEIVATSENDVGSIPILAFGIGAAGANASDAEGFERDPAITESYDAGALLHGGGPVTQERIKAALSIEDKTLRSEVLSGIVRLNAQSMGDEQLNTLLDDLYDQDKGQYANALIVKLPGLLRTGDLERASALRSVLLESTPDSSGFSMLAYVASCYSMAGLKQDAGAIVIDAYNGGKELSADDKKLILMAIRVGGGDYPPLQDFYDYKSDDVRLQAYLTLSVISRQLGRPEIARRAVGDAVRFIQKASVKVDRQKALGLILSATPGLF